MSPQNNRVVVPGSRYAALPGAQVAGACDPNARLEVTLRIRPRAPQDLQALHALCLHLPGERRYPTHAEYTARYGADPGDLPAIERFAQESHLTVIETSLPRRTVRLAGTLADMQQAFGVTLRRYTYPGGSYRGRDGEITIPAELAGIVEAVLGLDDRPVARPHFRRLAAQAAPAATFPPPQVARLYNFPQGATGQGQCIGILELGGGYTPGDLQTYFQSQGVTMPALQAVSVDGGKNAPTGDPNGPDGEVMLDIEVAGAVAPGAQIVVYFAPNTSAGFLDALTTAIHDQTHNPSILSISWGGPETAWSDQDLQQFDQALQAAATLGVTVCVAAGDNGASDIPNGETPPDDFPAHTDFPACDPYALACGGTKLSSSGQTLTGEVVWNEMAQGYGATGGGISMKFPVPTYQQGMNLPASINPGAGPGRGTPDVAGDADPVSGYQVRVDGQDTAIGGTSAVAPLWAGLLACINQKLGHRVGFLNPLLYSQPGPKGALNDITQGNNGGYKAGPGWDACTGWGSPNGTALLDALLGGGSNTA